MVVDGVKGPAIVAPVDAALVAVAAIRWLGVDSGVKSSWS